MSTVLILVRHFDVILEAFTTLCVTKHYTVNFQFVNCPFICQIAQAK